ncbi:hypothetical protein KCU98_g8940, partial [Aureobasidium melanogenum]
MAETTEMSQKPQAGGKRRATEYYKRVCTVYGTGPSPAELRQIELTVGNVGASSKVRGSFQYGLLFFLPRSDVVFKKNTLLVGWVHKADGSEQELWFKPGTTKAMVSFKCGAPPGSNCNINPKSRLCDKWHPSLETICKPWSGGHEDCRRMLYAYFTAVIRYIQASPRPPSIERAITNRTISSIPPNPAVTNSTPKRYVHTRRHEEDLSFVHNKSFDQHKNKSADRNGRKRFRARKAVESTKPHHLNDESHEEGHTVPSRFLLTGTAPIIDLTASDSEESVKCEPVMVPELIPANRDDHQPIPLAKQKLLDKLQSKKAHEIEDILAKRAGLPPEWIEKTMREEMEKKMNRDLEAVENML